MTNAQLKNNAVRRLLIVFCAVIACNLLHAQQKQLKPKVVLIIADGIPADVIERLKPPAMQQLVAAGAYTRAYVGGVKGTYKQTPTISAPGYTDMLTGTWGYKHNVWDNDDQHPNYNYPTIFRLFKTAKPQGKTAIFSTWEDNRTILLGAGLAQTGNMQVDYVFDGYEKDTVAFPHDGPYTHNIDEHVIHCADSVIRKDAPDLSWIYLEYTDDVGHAKGTGAAFDDAVRMLDKQMQTIASAIKYRETHYPEKWLLLLTTDHGRDSVKGHNHGGQSLRERTTWMIMNKHASNSYFTSAQPAMVDILPSVANYLNINLPKQVGYELDGTPFIGPVSVTNAAINAKGDALTVTWKAFSPAEKVKVYITYTNEAKQGGADNWQLLGTAGAGAGRFTTNLPGLAAKPFYKVVVEGKYNAVNSWHTENKPGK